MHKAEQLLKRTLTLTLTLNQVHKAEQLLKLVQTPEELLEVTIEQMHKEGSTAAIDVQKILELKGLKKASPYTLALALAPSPTRTLIITLRPRWTACWTRSRTRRRRWTACSQAPSPARCSRRDSARRRSRVRAFSYTVGVGKMGARLRAFRRLGPWRV